MTQDKPLTPEQSMEMYEAMLKEKQPTPERALRLQDFVISLVELFPRSQGDLDELYYAIRDLKRDHEDLRKIARDQTTTNQLLIQESQQLRRELAETKLTPKGG